MIKTTEQTTALNKALLQAQKSIQDVEKDSTNPHFRSRYASLTAVLQAVKGPLNEAGLLLTQSAAAAEAGNGLIVTTRITHAETSEWIETSIPIPLEQPTAQKVGSATTYGRRYGVDTLLALATADDDGTDASKDEKRTNGHRRPPAGREHPPIKAAGDLFTEIASCQTLAELRQWYDRESHHAKKLSAEENTRVGAAYNEREEQLSEAGA